ncbi:hypothetical protein JCM8547_001290 [Rhodosporidiobolus lusitaniae]
MMKKDLAKTDIEEVELPPEYRKATKTSWVGKIYDVWDVQDVEERRLLYKLDAVLVTFMSLGYFLKYLDQSNINSAYVSGMKEDLGMYGNELTTAITVWTVGYCIGQIPSNLALTRISPRYLIPALELCWGLATLCSYKVTSVGGLYAVRFFVGLAEAGFYPGAQFILGAFYKPSELGKRAVFFHTFGGIGTLISSVLQAAAYTNLSGIHGHRGWQWLFIIDAVITLPIAIMGFVFLPALPGQKSANKATFWLSEREWTIIDRRIKEVGRAPSRKLTWGRVAGFAKSWRTSIMSIWLKSFNTVNTGTGLSYTVPQINHYVMPITGVYVLTAWFFAWTSDSVLRGRRYPWLLVTTVFNAAICIALVELPLYQQIPAHFFLYYMTNLGGGQSGLLFSWATEACSKDNEERSLTIALMNNLAYVVQAIVPNFVWKQVDYPKCTIGLWYSAGLSIALFFWTLLTLSLHNRDKRRAVAGYDPTTSLSGNSTLDAAEVYGAPVRPGSEDEALGDKERELEVEQARR